MEQAQAQAALAAAENTPSLRRPPTTRRVIAGIASVVVMFAGSTALIEADPSRPVGIIGAFLVAALAIFWITRDRAGGASWARVDSIAYWACLIAATLPAQRLLRAPSDPSLADALVPSAIAALALGSFLALRWRQGDATGDAHQALAAPAHPRLTIMSSLRRVQSAEFASIRAACGLTTPELSRELSSAKDEGLIEVIRDSEDRQKITHARLTVEGRAAIDEYLTSLRQISVGHTG